MFTRRFQLLLRPIKAASLLHPWKSDYGLLKFVDISRCKTLGAMASVHSFADNVFSLSDKVKPSNTVNRDAFAKTAIVPALKIDKRKIHKVLKAFKGAMFERVRFQAVRDVPGSPNDRFLLLDPNKLSRVEALTERQRTVLEENEVARELHEFQLNLTYDDWQAHEVLQGLLPSDVEVPKGFSRIGHIIHLNLKDSQLKHKHLIGEVLLEKNPGITTVVNKLNEIDNTYRFFNMECIAGEQQTVVTVKECHLSYSFDFAKVYWNPRLSTEHERIVTKLCKQDVVYDVFAGVGPFAIPAAKKGCKVFANDLNPESYRWLQENTKKNKVSDRITASNLDGRQFLRDVVKSDLIVRARESFQDAAHVIMNLPALAVEFLDTFPSLLAEVSPDLQSRVPRVVVHCHGFSKAADPALDIRQRVESILKCPLNSPEIHNVRDVAPNKEMMCISFTVPQEILLATLQGINADGQEAGEGHDGSEEAESPSKKARTS
ncbi:tRNA (guanine(37)-N(1))-methyltransferase-like [Diadema antillarum]|uniref:tRNA (guanine(37)-N(1))-methyltransferase-like n=1 Tax=Diadema antillarum TaxID=105358 RepID=UPI003A88210B